MSTHLGHWSHVLCDGHVDRLGRIVHVRGRVVGVVEDVLGAARHRLARRRRDRQFVARQLAVNATLQHRQLLLDEAVVVIGLFVAG